MANELAPKYRIVVMNNKEKVDVYNSVDYPQMIMNGGYVQLSFMEVRNNAVLKKCDLLITTPYWTAIHEV